MDPTIVDRVSRLLAGAPTRRTTLGGLGVALAALITRPSPDVAAAPCPKGKKRCQRRCIPKRQCCRSRECGSGKVCRRGRCQCPAGKKACKNRCIAKTACCGPCPNGQVCDGGRCAPRRCATGGLCRVFASSQTFTGDLREGGTGSGIAGADAKCQRLADASPRTRGGIYKAWLSGTAVETSPSRRFTNTAGTGPYRLVNDATTLVATSFADLTDGALLAPIDQTEVGQSAQAAVLFAWTSTHLDGTPRNGSPVNCQDWSTTDAVGAPGSLGNADGPWTLAGFGACSSTGFLYCFEQG